MSMFNEAIKDNKKITISSIDVQTYEFLSNLNSISKNCSRAIMSGLSYKII